MKVSVPSNGNITPSARKSSARVFHSATRPAVLAEGAASTRIPLAEKRSTPARTMSFPRCLGRVGGGGRGAGAAPAYGPAC